MLVLGTIVQRKDRAGMCTCGQELVCVAVMLMPKQCKSEKRDFEKFLLESFQSCSRMRGCSAPWYSVGWPCAITAVAAWEAAEHCV